MLSQSITPFALSALKYGLLALLFLFIWRATRWAVRGLTAQPTPKASRRSKTSAEPEPRPTSRLLLHSPEGGRPRPVRIDGSTVIGRAPECELRLEDTYASSQHARMFPKNGNWYVEDLGSTNGTFVNEQRLAAPAMLQPGDRIRIGTTVLELR